MHSNKFAAIKLLGNKIAWNLMSALFGAVVMRAQVGDLTHAGVLASRNDDIAQATVAAFFNAALSACEGFSPQLADALREEFVREPKHPTYVACLQSTALAGKGAAAIPAEHVACSAEASGRLEAGALLVRLT